MSATSVETPAPSKKKRESVVGRAAILKELGAVVHKSGLDKAFDHPRSRVAYQVRAFITSDNHPGAADPLSLCRWWHDQGKRHYPDLLAGVRVLLSAPAGNAVLERIFGKCRSILSQHRKLSNCSQVFLRVNAPQLRLPGYSHHQCFDPEPTSQPDELE